MRGFSRRRPDVAVTTLRFANFIGPTVRTPLTEYFRLPVLPVVLGHDARLQFVHEDDGLAAPHRDSRGSPGHVQRRRRGNPDAQPGWPPSGPAAAALPGLVSATVGGLLRRAKIADFSPEQIQFLTYGRGVDTVRMRERLGFEPKHTTMHAFDSFADARCRDGLLDRDRVASADRMLVGAVRRVVSTDA